MTMTMMNNLPPGLILLAGALLLPLFPGRLKNWLAIALPALAFFQVGRLPEHGVFSLSFLDFDLSLLRADRWSKAFGYIFTLSGFAAFLYGYYEEKGTEFAAALFYLGSALMVVFAGDLITLYLFWEAMAVASVYLVLARKSRRALAAAQRYILVHIFGGLVLLAGIVLVIHETGAIAFTPFTPGQAGLGPWLILAGFLVNAAAPPFSSWLPDAYPESTVMGGVILSAYTSKTAVYTLLRGFPGWEILIVLGCVMAIYGIVYALLENDIRRLLAYCIINQVGFMVCGVGIGSALALNGAVAQAFCHILYKALLWMCAGAVLYRTGKSKGTDLGGLYRAMPLTLILGGIGALSIAAPFTSGFTSKTLIVTAAADAHLFWVWLILEVASAGAFLLAGLKFPYMIFFGEERGLRPREAPKTMLAAMAFLAFFCIYLGLFPERLYDILPDMELVKKAVPYTLSDIYIRNFAQVVTRFQMLFFSALAFFLCLPFLRRGDTISLDFDWLYRKGCGLFYIMVDTWLNDLNGWADRTIAQGWTGKLGCFCKNGPARLLLLIVKPLWEITGVSASDAAAMEKKFLHRFAAAGFTVAGAAVPTLLLLLLLYFI